MTVGEMKEWLEQFDENLPVVLTSGSAFISVCAGSEVVDLFDDEEDEEPEESFLVLTPCTCHIENMPVEVNIDEINPN